MKKAHIYFLVLISLVFIPMIVTHCSGDGKDSSNGLSELPEYQGWTKYTYRSFVFHYRRDASWREQMYQIAEAFQNALAADCEFFGKSLPEETIHLFIYNTPKEADALLGKDTPYIVGNQIHWERISTAHGAPIMMYLLKLWNMDEPKYTLFYEGMTVLRDYSKRNYHSIVGQFIQEGRYIPIDSLLDNEVYLSYERQRRSWEAASLIAFMSLNLGPQPMLDIWQSDNSFDENIQSLTGITLQQFELLWKDYATNIYIESVNDEIQENN